LTGNEYTLISSYVNNKTHVLLRHKTCGKDWKTRPDLFHNGTRCPCNQTKSKTSIAVKEVLDEVEIVYEEEKTFDWLKLEFGLRIDFFLPEYNLAIECDGEQHYISKQGREAEFPKTMNRDKTKFKLCKEHGIEVIRVPSLHGMMTSAFIIKQLYERDIIDLEI
jgi:hypothetical protein